jgi:glucose-6-phosphate dehydrogenase assembly protein OpcA
MIVQLPETTISKIGKKLQELREAGGVVSLGRVLTLIVETDFEHLESAVTCANGASRLHPSRIIVLAQSPDDFDESKLDAEIRVGGDAGASEVIILRAHGAVLSNKESLVTGLLLPDAPVVAWWPAASPPNPSGTEIGQIASRRITDSANESSPVDFLSQLAKNYQPGDGDMAWTRITLWRSQLTALMDQHQHRKLLGGTVFGDTQSPSAHLLASWLKMNLQTDVEITAELDGEVVQGIAGVSLRFEDGSLELLRSNQVAYITQPDAPKSSVWLPQRSDLDSLIEDMRFLGEDMGYAQVLKDYR